MTDIAFTAGKGELVTGLAWAARGLSSRPAVPILAGMWLAAGMGKVTLAGFDYEVTATSHVPADVTAAGVILPNGPALVKAVKGLPGKPGATVTAASDGESLTVECEGVSASVDLLSLDDYPQLPAMPAEVATVDGETFAGAVARVAPCASHDDTLPSITTVSMEFGEPGVTLAATDRYRLAVEPAGGQVSADAFKRQALIPAKPLAAYAKIADRKGKVTLHLGELGSESGDSYRRYGVMAGFADGTRDLIIHTVDGEFVPYKSLLPKDSPASVTVDAKTLADAVKRAGDAAERNTAVKLRFYRDTVTVTAERDGKTASKATLPATITGAPAWPGARVIGWACAFNPEYLRSLLLAVDGKARLGFQPGDAKPVLVTPEHGGAWRGLMVPIRIAGTSGWKPPATPDEVHEARERASEVTRRPAASGDPAAPSLPDTIAGLKDRHGHNVSLRPGKPGSWSGQPYSITASVAGGTRHYVATWHPSGYRAEFGGKRGASKFVKAHEDAYHALAQAARHSAA